MRKKRSKKTKKTKKRKRRKKIAVAPGARRKPGKKEGRKRLV